MSRRLSFCLMLMALAMFLVNVTIHLWHASPRVTLVIQGISTLASIAIAVSCSISVFRQIYRARQDLRLDLAELGTYVDPVQARRQAKLLLSSFLTPEQKATFKEFGVIHHKGQRGDYYINYGRQLNIHHFDNKGKPHILCCYPNRGLIMPAEDTMLAQLLWLRSDERAFLKQCRWY